jgi:hypothetical protein
MKEPAVKVNQRLIQVLILAASLLGLSQARAGDVTTRLPAVNASNWVIGAQTEVIPVPVRGWEILPGDTNASPGVSLREKTVTIDGEETPALEITYEPYRPPTNSPAAKRFTLVRIPLKIDAYASHVLTFMGKVEPAEGSKVLAGKETPRTGWFSYQFNKFMDNFGVALFDNGPVHWSVDGVPTTHFLNHVDPAEKRADGWSTFCWDIQNEDHTGNKGVDLERVAWLEITYDSRGVPDNRKSVITLANPRFVRGMRKNYPDAELVNAWTNFIESYKPDYSDSSRYLENPKEGRIAKPIAIAKAGKALAEIVVTTEGDANRIGNFVKNSDRLLETRTQKGNENLVHANAAAELKRLLGKITGADYPVLETPSAEKNVKIYLGASYAKKYFAKDLEKLAEGDCLDGYAIRVKDGNIYIFGAIPKGTLNGVYAFLENNSDIIFPRWSVEELGVICTPNPDLAIVCADTLDKPRMILRGWLSSAQSLVRNKCNFYHVAFDAQAWGGYTEVGGHCFSLSYNSGIPVSESGPYKKFYPLIDGKRPEKWSEYKHQMCVNHPDLYEVYVSHWRKGLNASSPPLQVLMIGPDDNWGLCECPYCSAPIRTPDGRTLTPKNFNEYYSTQFYLFLQRVADNLAEFRPGFVTSTFAYFFAAPLPAIDVGPNIRPWLCPYVRKDIKSPIFSPVNNHWWQLLKGWRAKTDQVVFRDYYGLSLQLHPIAEVLAYDLRAMVDAGALRLTAENSVDEAAEDLGAAEEAWVINRLMWNPDQDVEPLRKYYLRRTFREAAPAIEKFRGTIRAAWYKERRTVDFDENGEAGLLLRNLGLEKELYGYLDEALKAVKHPQSRLLVERMRAAFEYYMAGEPKPRVTAPLPKVPAAVRPPDVSVKDILAKAGGPTQAVSVVVRDLLARGGLTPDQKKKIQEEYARSMPTFRESLSYLEKLVRDNNLAYTVRRGSPGNRPWGILESGMAILRDSANATREEADEYIRKVSELTLGRKESLFAAYSAAAESFARRKGADPQADKRVAAEYLKKAIELNTSPKNNDAAAARLKSIETKPVGVKEP